MRSDLVPVGAVCNMVGIQGCCWDRRRTHHGITSVLKLYDANVVETGILEQLGEFGISKGCFRQLHLVKGPEQPLDIGEWHRLCTANSCRVHDLPKLQTRCV